MTRIYKFGGASIRNITRINKVVSILKSQKSSQLVIVFSAMGKVTNMLEKVVNTYVLGNNPVKFL